MPHTTSREMIKMVNKLAGQPAILPTNPSKISMTFFTMVLLKLHKHSVNVQDDCARKIIEELIIRLKTTSSSSRLRKSMKGGSNSESNEQNSRGRRRSNGRLSDSSRRKRSHRSRGIFTTNDLIAEANLKSLQQKFAFENDARAKMQLMMENQIKRASTGLTLNEHMSIMMDSAAKGSIPAIMVYILCMLTVDLLAGAVSGLSSIVKTAAIKTTETGTGFISAGTSIVSGTVQNVAPLNLIWNVLSMTNKAVVSGSDYIFGTGNSIPPLTVTQANITNYISDVDKTTDSLISIITNPGFSARVSTATFALCSLICYNIIVHMRKREIINEGKEAKLILSRISKMDQYQSPVDNSLSDTLLNMAPVAAGMGAMSFSGNPQYALGIAGITNAALKRAIHTRRQRERNTMEQRINQEPFDRTQLEQLEQVIPLHRRKPTRPHSPNAADAVSTTPQRQSKKSRQTTSANS